MRVPIAIAIACLMAISAWPRPAIGTTLNCVVYRRNTWDRLNSVAAEVKEHRFPYHFYLTQKLDVDERQLRHNKQDSVFFADFQGHVVLAITGNYYAAYSAKLVNKEQRTERTFLTVMFPILKAAVQQFQGDIDFDGYALEISHHILSLELAEMVAIKNEGN